MRFYTVQGVTQVSEDLFRCDVGTIGFLGFDVSPSLDLQVTVSENSCRLELVQCRVREPESYVFSFLSSSGRQNSHLIHIYVNADDVFSFFLLSGSSRRRRPRHPLDSGQV